MTQLLNEPTTSSPKTLVRIIDQLDVAGMVNCLRDLVKIPSVTGSDYENQAQHWFAERLRQTDLETDLWQIDLPTITADPEFPGMEVARSEAWGLVGSLPGTDKDAPTFVLNGHIDVVPPGDMQQWYEQEAYTGRVANGLLYGRGACDMKAGLVCNLFAVKAIQAAGVKLRGSILLESVVGEEDGGLGTFATLQRGYRGDAAIITEPTEMQIIPACAGALTFRLHMTGLSAHASVRRNGVSVIEKFWPIWKALEELEMRRNVSDNPLMSKFELPYPLSIGTLQAGNWPSSVPDQLVAEGRLGVALGESSASARRELEAVLAQVCHQDEWLCEHPARLEWFGGQFASGQTDIADPLIHLVSQAHQKLHGNVPTVHGAPYGSDLRLMTKLGHIPTLHYGPGSVKQAHAPNEYVPIAEMVQTAQTLIAIILQYCGD